MPSVTDATDRLAEQRRQVWSAGQTVLGWGGLIALVALAYVAIGFVPGPVAAGRDVIVFLDYKVVQTGLVWCGLVGGVLFFVALAATKTTRGIVVVCALFATVVGIGAGEMYSRFAAIAFGQNWVELRYLWPRPPVRLDLQEIVSA